MIRYYCIFLLSLETFSPLDPCCITEFPVKYTTELIIRHHFPTLTSLKQALIHHFLENTLAQGILEGNIIIAPMSSLVSNNNVLTGDLFHN